MAQAVLAQTQAAVFFAWDGAVTIDPDGAGPLFEVPIAIPLPEDLAFIRSRGQRSLRIAKCDVCGNDYDKSFEVNGPRGRGTFDSFECAIHKFAPKCSHCGCMVIGHGIEAGGSSIVARTARARQAKRARGIGSRISL